MRRSLACAAAAALALGACAGSRAAQPRPVRVGSKKFTESVILGELATQVVQAAGVQARHVAELGGTRVLWDALLSGEIDVYPEYTGTIAEELLPGVPAGDERALATALQARGVRLGTALGFSDGYALGMREDRAAALGIRRISDLGAHPELRFGLSHELLDRADGWPAVRARYGLQAVTPRGLDHDVAYRGLAAGAVDVIDLYTTDPEIRAGHVLVLEDDRKVFPEYRAVLLWRIDLEARAPAAVRALGRLSGAFDERAMIALNAQARIDHVPEAEVAARALRERLGVAVAGHAEGRAARIARRTLEHLGLVGVALGAALVLAIPLGVLAERRPRLGGAVLAAVGLVQTVPSIALLVATLPVLGIGAPPALFALFVYSLLPIVRSTHAGLRAIPGDLRASAAGLGLPGWPTLLRIELPLASRAILAGVKTSAVLCVGTATLGALVGAGGLGQPIFTGIRLDDFGLVLEGALPAAALALLAQGAFGAAERWLVPRGLRLPAPR